MIDSAPPKDVAALKALIANLAREEKAIRAASDFRSKGWRLLKLYRQTVALLEQIPLDDPRIGPLAYKALEVMKKNLKALENDDGYNKICERCQERSELDMFFWLKAVEHDDHLQRLDAVSAALELDWTATLPHLLELLQREEHPWVLSKLTKTIGFLGGEAELGVLEPFLTNEDARIRANTVEGLEAIDSEEKYPLIFRCIDDENNRVRANALRALRKRGSHEFASLLRRMASEPGSAGKASLLYVLESMRSDLARDCLFQLLTDEGLEITSRALDQLAAYPEPLVVDRIEALLKEKPGQTIAEAATRTLRAIAEGDPELAPRAMALVAEAGRPEEPKPERPTELERVIEEPPPAAAPAESSSGDDEMSKADIARLVARLAARGSRLPDKARKDIERDIRAGKIRQDSQLNAAITKAKAKSWGVR